jgi:hypothetical protein
MQDLTNEVYLYLGSFKRIYVFFCDEPHICSKYTILKLLKIHNNFVKLNVVTFRMQNTALIFLVKNYVYNKSV